MFVRACMLLRCSRRDELLLTLMVRAIVIRFCSGEKPTSMSFLGFSDRCQYRHVAIGFGRTMPAVYDACQMSFRLTRRVISC